MPFIELDDLTLYYETFGDDHAGKSPIILIHGSTDCGSTWGVVAPLLATQYKVIVPDCRGHGQSNNPRQSYSFGEMAADTAALVRALGYKRAHIIGHSNGGNVALLTLMKHPDIVQSAIIQAGNATVSKDLIEREPIYFDPERVERDEPEWLARMQKMHAPTHGSEYWKVLLNLTALETMSGPHFLPAELNAVTRPVLIIQGAEDRANAPGQHAQYMAAHIPLAEVWMPEGTGHTVHEERLLEWAHHVFDFLARRGDEPNEALYRLAKTRYNDGRDYIFDVKASRTVPQGWQLTGQVLYPGQATNAEKAVRKVIPGEALIISTRALLDDGTPWALTSRGVADLRRAPRMLVERISQTLLGEAIRILDTNEDWALVRLGSDGYIGWTQQRVLHPCSADEVLTYQKACNAQVVAELAPLYARPGIDCRAEAEAYRLPGKLAFTTRLAISAVEGDWAKVLLPDGMQAWVRTGDILMDAAPRPDIDTALQLIGRFAGTPYLWGGRTPFGYDCSGFAQTLHAFLGVNIPRDADQQFRSGQAVQETPAAGDLIFFGDTAAGTSRRFASVTHVAISLGGWEIIHANGTAWGISYNSLEATSPRYNAWLADHNLGVRRFL